MAELRLKKHCRAQYLTDFSYTWDTSYNRLLLDEDSPAKVRHTDYTDLDVYDCGSSECGTYTETELVFILPWKDSFHDVIDGVCRGSLRVYAEVHGGAGFMDMRYYTITDIVVIRESDGNIMSLGSYTSPTEHIHADSNESNENDIQYQFFIDVDNELVDENHRAGLRVRSYARKWTNVSLSETLRLCHTFNEDDTFVNLKYV